MSEKKKIFIMSHALELGGAERSLIGLLHALDTEQYDIDLFLMRHEGELLHAIPEKIHVLPEVPAYTVLARPMAETLSEGHFLLTTARMLGKTAAYLYDKKNHYTDSGVSLEYSHKYTACWMPKINDTVEYDLAISFLTPHYFVAQKVRAKKKMAWIHTDYTKVQIHKDSERKMWEQFDFIASISEAVTKGFVSIFPELEKKIVLIENILPQNLIEQQTNAFDAEAEMASKGIKLLSIGRYCTAKNFDNVPEICSKIVQSGVDVHWYIIGFGPDEALIREKIHQYQMEERVILLGKKENPYPYIKACDFYVQPSRYEGKSVTVREAQMLGKPVVITNYATAKSQLEDGVDGVIVPMDIEGCAKEIVELLQNTEKAECLKQNCRKRDFSNREEVYKIADIL